MSANNRNLVDDRFPNMRMGANKDPFAVRKNTIQKEPKRKYVMFFEGEKTEFIYFDLLKQSKKKKENIIVHLEKRWKQDSGYSNQHFMVEYIIRRLEQIKNFSNKDRNKMSKYSKMFERKNFSLNDMLELTNFLKDIPDKYPNHFSSTDDLQTQLKSVDILSSFDETYDKVCLVIDRDKGSFTESQFDDVLELARNVNIDLYITNPCFEFYLLLHLVSIEELDTDKILKNEKVGKKTYVEYLLNEKMKKLDKKGKGYKKNKYNADYFIENFEYGYSNAQKLCCTNAELKNKIGSSVFLLVDKLIKHDF